MFGTTWDFSVQKLLLFDVWITDNKEIET